MSTPSWDKLQQPSASAPQEPGEFESVCADIFTTTSGKRLLAELRRRHFDTGGNDLADSRALRVRIAKQQFVRDLETACERGLAARQKPRGP